jgi:hypothetical protein
MLDFRFFRFISEFFRYKKICSFPLCSESNQQAAFLLCQFISYIIPYNKGVAPQCNPFLFVVPK